MLAHACLRSAALTTVRRPHGPYWALAEAHGDASPGDQDAQLLQLTDNAQVAPAGVLTGQADDQFDRGLREGWASWQSVCVGPAPADQGPVPAQDRLGRYKECRPTLAWTSLARAAMSARSVQLKRGRAI